MAYSADIIIRIVIAVALAVLFGNGSVVAFNNIRPKWFEDYDPDDPAKEITGEPRRILPPTYGSVSAFADTEVTEETSDAVISEANIEEAVTVGETETAENE